jgi:metal-dependent amidase/aminoacylase/carboxypeptidase family protein
MGAGTARNVLAESAWLKGTIRTRLPGLRQEVIASVEKIVVETSRALGGQARLELRTGYPRVANDPGLLELTRRIGRELFGPERIVESREPTMGADDFSYYLSEQGGVPGCMIRIGLGGEHPLHSSRFDFGHQALAPTLVLLRQVSLAVLAGEGC